MTNFQTNTIAWLFTKAVDTFPAARKTAIKYLDNYVLNEVMSDNSSHASEKIKLFRYHAYKALYYSFFRNFEKGIISKKVTNKIISSFLNSVIFKDPKAKLSEKSFFEKYKQNPPRLVTISLTKKCNLNCDGCYATSTTTDNEQIDWDTLNKLMDQLYIDMGMRFFVISGGEPFLYNSNGNSLIDLAASRKDCYFLVYTNGTLINNDLAARIASCGNITPAISVEGFQPETDKRRGKGAYNKILKAVNCLLKNGVPYGFSVTATKNNFELLMCDDFYKFSFEEIGATYMWVFQYMPIGRNINNNIALSPHQRIELFKKQKEIMFNKNYFLADFWNSAIITEGCISCGKEGGYFYINWDGNIMPCVFIPYFSDNIYQLFSEGRSISDALFSDFFIKGRKWQSDYLNKNHQERNLLMPCLYRDHHNDFLNIVNSVPLSVYPENDSAREAMESKEYHENIMEFDKDLDKKSQSLWQEFSQN